MAAHPGGLCAPGVRSEGNRNTAEPCTRLPSAGQRDPSRFLRPDGPRPPASRPAAPPARLPEPGGAVTWALRRARPGLGSGRTPPGPLSSTPQASHSGRADGLCGLPPSRCGPWGAGPALCPRPPLSLGAPHQSGAQLPPRGEARLPRAALSALTRSEQASALQPCGLLLWSLGSFLEDFG